MKLDKDFQDLLFVFNANNVRYLVVGGFAFSFHAEPRGTKDFDIWIESSRENSRLVYKALAEYGAPIGHFSPDDFLDGKSFFQLGVPPNRVDVMQTIEAVEFNEAWGRHSEGRTEDGVPFHVISREDLIVNKSAVGRARDLADVERLRELDR